MATHVELAQALETISPGDFQVRAKTPADDAEYYPTSRVVENVPWDDCDTIVTASSHAFDYAADATAALDALEGVITKEAAIEALLENGVQLDLRVQP